MRETFGRPAARFPLRYDRSEEVSSELRQWAPSRWSASKIVLFLRHMRNHLLHTQLDGTFQSMGVTDAVMTVDVALSELAMIHRKCFRVVERAKNGLVYREKICGSR